MKKTILLLTLLSLVTINFTNSGNAKVKSYYSGDAINYQGQIIIASTNTGNLELFTLDNDKLNLAGKIVPNDAKYNIFYDVVFEQQWDRLYAYVTSGRYLYQYDVSDLDNPILRKQIKDNSWDWFGDLDKVEGRLVTKGNKFIKIWNSDLEVINSYNFVNATNPYNIIFAYYDNAYVYDINEGKLRIFDRNSRQIVRNVELAYNQTTGNHRLHPDALDDMIYVVDDEALKKYSHVGGFYDSLEHNSGYGYDVIYSTDGKSLYFSNGLKVQKVSKGDLTVLDSFDNASLNLDGSWAMGLVRVMDSDWNELITVFNNNSILVLNNKLEVVAKHMASETDNSAQTSESLWLNIDKLEAQTNDVVTVYGGGFAAGEDITVSLERNTVTATADTQGRFQTEIRVPLLSFRDNVTQQGRDIKAVGQLSGLHYNIGLRINK